ncbi:Bestrophin, RFP-TM, chloride channel-domain-containing protein [Armillaria fumosa]|nr:Bestrophin, RFP-TM, chloride channel-domain-containing protein [Armillaria fumosa]
MVAYNPVLRGKWTIKKFNATVINDIWPEVLFFSAVATMVTFVSIKTPHSLAISPQLLTVLGTVLGLVISFRTSTAYERYQDGRKMWANISIVSRNLAQMIWIHVPNERLDKEQNKVQTTLESVIEKKTMINLVQAFSVAIKHFLRGENGVYYQDLYPLICFLPRFASNTATGTSEMLPLWQASEDGEHPYDHNVHSTIPELSDDDTPESKDRPSLSPAPSSSWLQSIGKRSTKSKTKAFDPEKALASVHSHRPLKPARNPPKVTLYDYIPILLFFKWIGKIFSRRIDSVRGATRNALGRKIKPQLQESNVPLEITIYLSSYSAFLMRHGLLQPAIAASITANIGMLQDTMNNLGRIATTPLPFAYQAHLRMSLWIYLFLLPFQVFDSFKYLTIPATAFASFLLLGFLEIGSEIENPFNYDLNDLDLDSFCLAIQRELQEITAHPLPEPASFIFTPWNQPFAPGDRRTAAELVKGQSEYGHAENDENGMASIKQTLLRSWRHTDDLTREAP